LWHPKAEYVEAGALVVVAPELDAALAWHGVQRDRAIGCGQAHDGLAQTVGGRVQRLHEAEPWAERVGPHDGLGDDRADEGVVGDLQQRRCGWNRLGGTEAGILGNVGGGPLEQQPARAAWVRERDCRGRARRHRDGSFREVHECGFEVSDLEGVAVHAAAEPLDGVPGTMGSPISIEPSPIQVIPPRRP
jgi:hypothetical protein